MKITDGRLRLSASDVANFLACQYLTRLDLLAARGVLRPPDEFDIGFLELVRRGETHERTVLGQFRADGHEIAEIIDGPDAASVTLAAIRSGVGVIYQGVLTGEQAPDGTALLGYPDFLVRADLLPAPYGERRSEGAHYEVVDAKLARSAKGRAVAQATFYSHLLTDMQGVAPRWMHLALGTGELASFKVSDYAAYERQARRVLGDFIAADPADPVENPLSAPYPEPVEHCAICRWSKSCAARRRHDDDLSLIAGITRSQQRALKAADVATMRGFARLDVLPGLNQVSPESLQRAQLQARLQVNIQAPGASPVWVAGLGERCWYVCCDIGRGA